MKTSLSLIILVALTGCANGLVDDVPRLYACDRSAGLNSCPGGWRCGLSGYCQDPAQGLPYACENSDDCSASWHCGQERLCFDRDAARDRSCRLELEASPETSDCAPGWRCGRELRGQVCHPVDAGAGYLCTSDSDCEAGWRCGIEGACVDVATQRLQPRPDVIVTTTRLSPRLPSDVDVHSLTVLPRDLGGTNQLLFSEGNTLTLLTSLADPTDTPAHARATATLLRPLRAVAMTEGRVLATDATGLVDYFDAFDGGSPALLEPSLADMELRFEPKNTYFDTQEELAAFSGSTVGVCGRGAGNLYACDPSTFQLAMLPATITDVAFIEETGTGASGRRSVLAATTQGPYFAPRAGSSFVSLDGGSSTTPEWRKVALPGLSDACASPPVALDRLAYDVTLRMLAVTSDQDRRLTFFKRPAGAPSTGPCSELAVDREYGPCSACGPGERLIKVGSAPGSSADAHSVVALCERARSDGGVELAAYLHQATDGGCGLVALPLPSSVKEGYQVTSETFGLQGVDAIGSPRACPQGECDAMLFARAPDRVCGGPGRLEVHADDRLDPSGGHVGQPSGIVTGLGLELVQYRTIYVAGSVVEAPDWMIGSSGSVNTLGDQAMVIQSRSRYQLGGVSRAFVMLNRSSDLLPTAAAGGLGLIDATATKAFGTLTDDADGTPWLIVGAGDRIWAEDARLLSEDGGLRIVNVKTVPIPSAEIQSLAFAAYDRRDAGTGPLLEGFTVEQNRLFRVRVHSAQLWLPDEIRIGETGIVPVAVWMEGQRGRVGTADGRVFGLPIPVPLSPTIPEAPLPTVLAYGALCGQAFALSPTALYRLSSDTQPLGNWRRVSLESAQPGLDSFGPHWSPTLHKARVGDVEHLYLFSESGLALELSATCAP